MSEIVRHFPYETPRQLQSDVLQVLGDLWDQYDVFCIIAPTAAGKSALAKAISNWNRSTSIITPTNVLVDQFLDAFPDTPTMRRLDSYHCDTWLWACSKTRGKEKGFCKGCKAAKELAVAKYKRGPGIYTYHTYMGYDIYRDILVVDEAHNTIPVLQDMHSTHIWQHDYQYPSNLYTSSQILDWLTKHPDSKNARKHKKIKRLIEILQSPIPTHVIERTLAKFEGKGTLPGKPEMRDCIRFYSISPADVGHLLWPESVQKVILMSATIGRKDIEDLGLHKRRAVFLHCDSPIPPERRPIYPISVVGVNRHNLDSATEKLASYIENEIVPSFPGQKGVIHATYQMAKLLREHLTDDRYMFHTKETKSKVYRQFRQLPPESGACLVASGMYEGIDLPDDLGRWQVITKIPWGSLGDPATRYRAEQDPEWYRWNTLKHLIQACGRISRHPEDYGTTFILDSTFERLYNESHHLLPRWFEQAVYLNGGK